jgi:hypothetical protein
MPVIEDRMFQNGTYQTTGYDHPVKFVTTPMSFCYESPDSCRYETCVNDSIRVIVLFIFFESQTKKRDELQRSHFISYSFNKRSVYTLEMCGTSPGPRHRNRD